MTTLGGGWTLVLKADGRKKTFTYSAALWTNTTTLNPNATAIDLTEAKFASYSTVPMKQVMVVMRDPITMTSTPRKIILSKTAKSLYDVIRSNKYVALGKAIGRNAWKKLMANGSLQKYCNREGFNNFIGSNQNYSYVRIGIIGNNENDCASPDSMIGVGGGTFAKNGCHLASISVSNVSGGICAPDNGDRKTSGFAYVYVRNGLPWALTNNAYSWPDGSHAKSCNEYRNPPTGTPYPKAYLDGMYWIEPSTSTVGAFKAYCDMKTDGGGYTWMRYKDSSLVKDQNTYSKLCAKYGMEVIVPRTRNHAMAIKAQNGGEIPNLANIFPKKNGASGLSNWRGVCQGKTCSFWISNSNNANCKGFEPNGDNNTSYRLYRYDKDCDYGRWNDANNTMSITGWVICSTNDK